jgi:hypothetical protein
MYAEYLRNYDQSQALLLRLQAKHKDFKVFTEVRIITIIRDCQMIFFGSGFNFS